MYSFLNIVKKTKKTEASLWDISNTSKFKSKIQIPERENRKHYTINYKILNRSLNKGKEDVTQKQNQCIDITISYEQTRGTSSAPDG